MVDIDGVVADVRHRLHHLRGGRPQWERFFAAAVDDPVHPEGRAVVERLAEDHDVVFLTGRPEHLRDATVGWLDAHGLGGHELVMRRDGDRRPAVRAKLGALRELAAARVVAIVVDDDAEVVDAVREAGWPVFSADWERRSPAQDAALTDAQERDGGT